MIRAGFLSLAERQALVGLARDGLAEHRIARRANAIVLLDAGWSCAKVASALLLDDDTVRGWYRAYESNGLNGISSFGHEGSACRLAEDQQRALKDWITARLPRSTKEIGAWIEKNFALSYSRPGLIALLHRLGFDYRKPREAPRHLNEAKQKTFIAGYEKLLNTMDIGRSGRIRRCRAPHTSGPRCRMLGTEGYCDCGRTDHRSSVTQHSWCDQSGDGPHTDAGSGQSQCKKPDRIAQGGRSCTSP